MSPSVLLFSLCRPHTSNQFLNPSQTDHLGGVDTPIERGQWGQFRSGYPLIVFPPSFLSFFLPHIMSTLVLIVGVRDKKETRVNKEEGFCNCPNCPQTTRLSACLPNPIKIRQLATFPTLCPSWRGVSIGRDRCLLAPKSVRRRPVGIPTCSGGGKASPDSWAMSCSGTRV